MKQALVGQGMDREQENSHLEWLDHTESLQSSSNVQSRQSREPRWVGGLGWGPPVSPGVCMDGTGIKM